METGNLEQITSTINSAVSDPVACNAEIVGNYFNPKRVDVRLCILARAAALHELVEADELGLDEAFDRLVEFVEPFLLPLPPPKPVTKPKPTPKRAPQTTCDALAYELRTHGVARLKDRRCLGRLSDVSTDQTRRLIASLMRLRPSYSAITDELLFELGKLL